ncbi:4Fe-4S dicluster domain-containing protein [Desulfosarcina sp. OttesenSCG-928-A07]|nr:4Fe-4S dicluster domain-containing protein [Desulfosarcina sp. OttesenSCG-928-G17]MDL2328458.1 4Fe-4S dicluster domain-containing protein [Desulfosarcina sp. OttesenSCG-928-A07]
MSTFLRPPGVLSEEDFQKRCISCGQCAQVCVFNCVELVPDFFLGGTTPRLYQRKSPCFLCMKCSAICPTNALRDVPMEQSGMGKAFLDAKKCVDYQEEAMVMCWTCYERCPMKGTAIVLGRGGYIPEVQDACVGCGVCEYVCPIHAISVVPARHLAGGG